MTDADLGAALPLPVPSAEMQDRLARRRSASAQSLAAPGPTRAEIERILLLGARTPDHGKLFPWRFVVLGPVSRAALAAALTPMAARQSDPGKAAKVLSKLTAPPLTILVLSTPVIGHKVNTRPMRWAMPPAGSPTGTAMTRRPWRCSVSARASGSRASSISEPWPSRRWNAPVRTSRRRRPGAT